ncbi:MAG: hypothetical protein MUC69_08555 [Gemmatimonadales bacterium]|nr:hypothetical protein [Gemmatimonadales bacterium]
MHRAVTLALLGASLLAAPPVAAQQAVKARPPALFAGAGGGLGWFRLSCPDLCVGERNMGWNGVAQVGVQFGRLWNVGLEFNGFFDSRERIRETAHFIGAVAHWYPAEVKRFWLKGGLGVFNYTGQDPLDGDDTPFTVSALGVQFGAGYDVPVSGRFHLAPYAGFIGNIGGDLEADGLISSEPNMSHVQLGVMLRYR